ncbi:NUDIX domain-containing protein [Latilactobacillus fuchuensis]|uniref:Nucleotide hydrolase, NUDIX family n=2 Tax=Latilactobacillus fuchuensis TaxID=164393 RepID=A0A2N9DTB6_9LACO|nr:NUDIX domain-containing protein [Latilactobacillus fuchuensis]KRL60824.1 hypothetical protein FC69_GL001260 [Latilactobacillus fuchuensis DSM 14340 = JCM 11249]MCP8857323.1 NUDIX domain-containing protein [Latilactobacillus fuchuensis]SPC36801.1 putative nucleotide hydrolase, NUDIX family [Latilactobacillus fuchuensis]
MTKRRYNLAIIRYQGELLLLNRLKKPYPGMWNGIGGKREASETVVQGMQREIFEETGLNQTQYQLHYTGWLDWHIDGQFIDGIDLFVAEIDPHVQLPLYPTGTREGILQLHAEKWVLAPNNYGVVADLKAILPEVLALHVNRFYTDFHEDQLIGFETFPQTEAVPVD